MSSQPQIDSNSDNEVNSQVTNATGNKGSPKTKSKRGPKGSSPQMGSPQKGGSSGASTWTNPNSPQRSPSKSAPPQTTGRTLRSSYKFPPVNSLFSDKVKNTQKALPASVAKPTAAKVTPVTKANNTVTTTPTTTSSNRGRPAKHQFACISSCNEVFATEEEHYQHFLAAHCFDGTPIPTPQEVDRVKLVTCPNCNQVFKRGLIHQGRKCKISAHQGPLAHLTAKNSHQLFREKFCSFDFETLEPGTHMPHVQELFDSRAPSLGYMPDAENIRADLRKIFVAVVRSLERSYKANRPVLNTWTFLLGLNRMLLSIPIEKHSDAIGTATIINQRIQMCLNGDFEALYTGYRHVIQSLARSSETRKPPNPDSKIKQILSMIKSGDIGRAAKRLDSNATIADVTDETVWSQIEELFGLSRHNNMDSVSEANEFAGLAELFEGICERGEIHNFTRPLSQEQHGPPKANIPARTKCPVLTTDIVRRALQTQSQSSAGITGWHASHLSTIADSEDGIRCLTYVLNRIFAKDVPEEVFEGLRVSLLVPLTKDNGGIRPILIGDCLMRLLAKCIVEAEQHYIASRMEPIQVAVGMKGGNEMVIHGIRAHLESNPNHMAIAVDFKNAFGTIKREAIAIELDKLDYEQVKFTKWFFNTCGAQASPVLSPDGRTFAYSRGVPQGGPTSMQWFCLALQPALVLIQKIMDETAGRVMASADDVFLMADSETLKRAFKALEKAAALLGLIANPGKCRVLYIHDDLQIEADELCEELGFTESPQKVLRILGTPVGDPVEEKKMAEEMIKEEAFQELEKIQDLQCRMLLLRHCLNAKYLHLARTLGPDSSHDALAKVDRLVKKALFKILDQVPGDSDEDIMLEASLPLSMGGLGLHLLQEQRFIDYYASASAAVLRWRNILPRHSTMLREIKKGNSERGSIATRANLQMTLRHCNSICTKAATTPIVPTSTDKAAPEEKLQKLKIPQLPKTIEDLMSGTTPNVHKLQYQLGQVQARITFRRIWRSIPKDEEHAAHRVQMLAKTTGTPCLALVALPTEPGLMLSNMEMKIMSRQYLSLPLEPTLRLPTAFNIRCCCSQIGSRTNEFCKGTHLYNCQKENSFKDRHSAMQNLIIQSFASVGLETIPEPQITPPSEIVCSANGNEIAKAPMRFDIIAPPVSQENKQMCMDLTIVSHVTREHLLNAASQKALHHASQAVGNKRTKYQNCYDKDYQVFLPLVAETSGAIHFNFEKLFENLATRVNGRPPIQASWAAPTFAKYWMQRTSVELWRQISHSLIKIANSSLRLDARATSPTNSQSSYRSGYSTDPDDYLSA